MSAWLNTVINEGGEHCRNCSDLPDFPMWRVLREREIEACPNCGDSAYDVYDYDEDDPFM